MSTITTGSIETILGEGAALLEDHWRELATHPDLMNLAPDAERYMAMEAAGVLLVLLVRDEADRLIGYSVCMIGQHLHYGDLRYAHNDVLYLAPGRRAGGLGLRLIRETERACREAGAQFIVWHAKKGTDLDRIMPKLGYAVQDTLYSTVL